MTEFIGELSKASHGPPHLQKGSFSSAQCDYQGLGFRERVGGALAQPCHPSDPFCLAGSTMNCSPRPLLWVILLLLAVALV